MPVSVVTGTPRASDADRRGDRQGRADHVQFDWVSAGISYGVFVGSLTIHEAAHAWAAWQLGDDTAQRGGQVSLDPTPHIRREPVGMVLVPALTYLANGAMIGWASTPIDPQWARQHPRRSALVALAGPAANLLLVLLAVVAMLVGVGLGKLEIVDRPGWQTIAAALDSGIWPSLGMVLSLLFSLNLLLLVFNLIPLPPLDGASLILLALPPATGERYLAWLHRGGLGWIGLLAAWKLIGVVFPPVWLAAVRLLHA